MQRAFFYSAGALLILTAEAKLVSSGGSARSLGMPDPVFGLPFRWVFFVVGNIELAVGLMCFAPLGARLRAGCVGWLASNFVIYRLGLWLMGWHQPCGCLGTLSDSLHLSPQTADTIMKGVLAYLLIGSLGLLVLDRLRGNASSLRGDLPRPEIA